MNERTPVHMQITHRSALAPPVRRTDVLQHAAIHTTDISEEVPPIQQNALRSSRQTLDMATHAFEQPRFGHNSSQLPTYTAGQHRLGDWIPFVPRSLENTQLQYPSSLADLHRVRALVDQSGIHLGTEINSLGKAELDALLAHESAHRLQQLQGEQKGERTDIELEAHQLATKLLTGQSVRPRFRANTSVQYFDTPHDKLVVERAKKRLALLKTYMDELEVREIRRSQRGIDRDPLVKKRSQMDEGLPEPRGHRENIEKEKIAKLNRLPLRIEVIENEVKFYVKFHVRFEDPSIKSRFGELKTSVLQGIQIVWAQQLKGAVFSGRQFTIVPEFTLISENAARNQNFWLITVRANDIANAVYPSCQFPPTQGVPTSVTDSLCDGGVMSLPPLHIAKPDVLGHEILHLFGLVDRYIAFISKKPGKQPVVETIPSRETGGRLDPLGGEEGTILAEDLAFLFDNLGIYALEENRGLDTLRKLEANGLSIEAVRAEIHRQEEIIRLGKDPGSLIRTRKDFRDKVMQGAEDL